jgi:ectoine hydroxylase
METEIINWSTNKEERAMQLNEKQLHDYERDGFLLVPEVLESGELTCLRQELPTLFAEDSPRRVQEVGSDQVRSVYGSHLDNALFEGLTRLPRLLDPVRQLLGGEVYVYQFKINAKAAFVGDTWPWHQDFIFWNKEDGLPEPQLVNVGVFLDDVVEWNGPLLFIPGSQRRGMIDVEPGGGSDDGEPEWAANLKADLKYSVDPKTVRSLVDEGGIAAPKDKAGSLVLFHPNVVHGSVANISPFSRVMVIITYCSMDNVIVPGAVAASRPDFLATRRATAVEPLALDSLRRSDR